MINHTRHDYIELSLVYLCAVIFLITLTSVTAPIESKRSGIIAPFPENNIAYSPAPFKDIKIIGKAFVVYDIIDNKVIAEKNSSIILPIASITKVMTAITALSKNRPDKIIKIDQKSVEGGYDLGLKKNQTWKLGELLKYMLVFSSNDGAVAIANGLGGEAEFVGEMNKQASVLGLNLHFTNPAGLDIDGKVGGKGSALSVAKLFVYARKNFPKILDATTKKQVTVNSSTGKIIGIPNTNQEILYLVGAEASKTGFTEYAGGNLAVVVDISLGRPVVIVVLGSTVDGRFKDMETLYNALRASIR